LCPSLSIFGTDILAQFSDKSLSSILFKEMVQILYFPISYKRL
jgi:hypothetical protein